MVYLWKNKNMVIFHGGYTYRLTHPRLKMLDLSNPPHVSESKAGNPQQEMPKEEKLLLHLRGQPALLYILFLPLIYIYICVCVCKFKYIYMYINIILIYWLTNVRPAPQLSVWMSIRASWSISKSMVLFSQSANLVLHPRFMAIHLGAKRPMLWKHGHPPGGCWRLWKKHDRYMDIQWYPYIYHDIQINRWWRPDFQTRINMEKSWYIQCPI